MTNDHSSTNPLKTPTQADFERLQAEIKHLRATIKAISSDCQYTIEYVTEKQNATGVPQRRVWFMDGMLLQSQNSLATIERWEGYSDDS